MPHVGVPEAGQSIQVFSPLCIPNHSAFAFDQDQGLGVVVRMMEWVKQVLSILLQQFRYIQFGHCITPVFKRSGPSTGPIIISALPTHGNLL